MQWVLTEWKTANPNAILSLEPAANY
jgi:hypothetical protein